MTDITIRDFEDRDLPGTLETMRLSLGETPLTRRTPEWFSWKHIENVFGRSILVVAESDDMIVGVRAFLRWELNTVKGAVLRCVRPVDTATHPEYRRRGIFEQLSQRALEMAVADDVDMVFNTPNAKSGAGYLKMGWTAVGTIGVMVRPSLRLLWSSPTESGPIGDSVADHLDPADVHVRQPRGLATNRTPGYFKWRFGGHPTAGYRMVTAGPNLAVVRPNTRNSRSELVVSDVFGPEPERALREVTRQSRSDYVIASFPTRSPERGAALRAGLLPVPGLTGFTLVANPLKKLDTNVGSPSSWDLTLGDLELL